jgi:formylmethanofuran dehydrogenase subunit E
MEAATSQLQEFLRQTSELHKHLCPRQVLGVRVGIYAAELFGLDLPQSDKRLFAFVETDGCFADGVSVATGCWLGHRTLRLMDYGKVAATFADTQTGRAVRIWPGPRSRSLALEYAPDAPSRWHAQLEGYKVVPAADLFVARDVTLTVPLQEIISKPGLRAVCDRCGEEILNEREVIYGDETLCRPCAGLQSHFRF